MEVSQITQQIILSQDGADITATIRPTTFGEMREWDARPEPEDANQGIAQMIAFLAKHVVSWELAKADESGKVVPLNPHDPKAYDDIPIFAVLGLHRAILNPRLPDIGHALKNSGKAPDSISGARNS